MSKHLSLVGVAIIFAISWGAFALDVPLTYQKNSPQTQDLQFWGYSSPTPLLKCPPGDWKLPKLTGDNPIYLLIDLGDSKRLLIFDRKTAKDPFYNRLHFDANANQDLTDDPVIDGQWAGNEQYDNLQFQPIETTIQVNGKPLPYCFNVGANCWNKAEFKKSKLTEQDLRNVFNCWLSGQCLYQGEFSLESARYKAVLIDQNSNGRFDDRLSVPNVTEGVVNFSGDMLYLRPVNESFRRDDGLVLGDSLLVNGKLFDVRVSIPEGKMTLTANAEKLVPIKLAMDAERVVLDAKAGKPSVMMFRPGKEVALPQGDYRVLSYSVLRKDDTGSVWLLSGQAMNESPFAAAGGTLTFGEPYTVWADVPRWSAENFSRGGAEEVQLALNIQGAGNERVTNLERISGEASSVPLAQSNVNRPKEPAYKVAASDGEVVTQGSFQYG